MVQVTDFNNGTRDQDSLTSILFTFIIRFDRLKIDSPSISVLIVSNCSAESPKQTLLKRTKRENEEVQNRQYLREEVLRVLSQVVSLRRSDKMPASSHQALDNLNLSLHMLLAEVEGRPTS